MTDENKDVKQDEAKVEDVQPQKEQTEEQVEASSQPVDGKDYKAIAEQLSKDIKEKNRKIQEQKKILEDAKQVQQPVQPVISEDETVKRFLATEANATIAVKLQTDPSFKDRVEIVQAYVAQGYDINMADKLAKADIMDKILSEKSETETPVITNQMKPNAIQEQVRPQPTGNSLDDIQNGKVTLGMEDEEALREVLKKYRPA